MAATGRWAAKTFASGPKYGRRCFICLKLLKETARIGEVILEDDSHRHVEVGSDCFARVIKAGYDGVKSGKGLGPMVFATTAMAEAYARRGEAVT